MRLKHGCVLAGVLLALAFVMPQAASAFFWDRPDQPDGWDHLRTVRHWVYTPHYRHQYLTNSETDRHAYHYAPRGYYPYYNSGYWGRAHIQRQHNILPPYYASWGAPKKRYHHVEWHNRHYGGHRRGDW